MACMLRSALNICRVRPAVGIPARISSVSSVGCQRLLTSRDDKKVHPESINKPVDLSCVVRQFATSSVASSSAGGHDHGKLWSYEKLVTLALLGVTPLHVMYPNILFDLTMAGLTVMHTHWGLEAVTVDYVRPIIFGNTVPKLAVGLVYAFSIMLLVGLLNLIFNGVGLGNSIRLIWRV